MHRNQQPDLFRSTTRLIVMPKSILEQALGNVRPVQPGNPQSHSDLLFNLNHWRTAWGPYLTDVASKPFQSFADLARSEHKMCIAIGLLLYISDNGHPYSTSIQTGLGLTALEYSSLIASLSLIRRKISESKPTAVKSLTRNLNDRIRQISR